MPQKEKKPGKGFTYADNLTWPEDQRWEIIDGEAFVSEVFPPLPKIVRESPVPYRGEC